MNAVTAVSSKRERAEFDVEFDETDEKVELSPPPQTSCASLIPFQIVRSLDSTQLHKWLERSIQFFVGNSVVDDLPTSCIYQLVGLSVLFSGMEKAILIYKRMSSVFKTSFYIPRSNNATFYPVKLVDLLGGACLVDIEKYLPLDVPLQKRPNLVDFFIKHHVLDFYAHIDPQVKKCLDPAKTPAQALCDIDHIFSRLDFAFNRKTIATLSRRMEANSAKLKPNRSFIYYCLLFITDGVVYHAFAIEQFYFKGKPHGLFRLYQSWVEQMTLQDYFKKRGYGETVEGCLDYSEMSDFLGNLHLLLLNRKTSRIQMKEIDRMHEENFGVTSPPFPQPNLFFNRHEKALYGISLRWFCDEINPENCRINFESLMSKVNS